MRKSQSKKNDKGPAFRSLEVFRNRFPNPRKYQSVTSYQLACATAAAILDIGEAQSSKFSGTRWCTDDVTRLDILRDI